MFVEVGVRLKSAAPLNSNKVQQVEPIQKEVIENFEKRN